MRVLSLVLSMLITITFVSGFCIHQSNRARSIYHLQSPSFRSKFTWLFSSAPSDVDDTSSEELYHESSYDLPERTELKNNLLKLCASYDRGFGATPKSRRDVDEIIQQLESLNPTPSGASSGIEGDAFINSNNSVSRPPLEGIWRMAWTTALDVLNLGASPITSVGAIYQVIEPPIATNIIDLIPRAQALFPTAFPSTLLRVEVTTRASYRPNMSNRVGLTFEAVRVKPKEIFGMNADSFPPLSFDLPRINLQDIPGVDPQTAPGFFDVTYLDEDMLIIKQNAPGGYFVSIQVPDCDP